MVENLRSCGHVSGRFTATPSCCRMRMNSCKSSSVSSMIFFGNGPCGISASERLENSATCELRSAVGKRAFSGLPTMTSSSGSHSLQLQTRDIRKTPPNGVPPSPAARIAEEVGKGYRRPGNERPGPDEIADSKIEDAKAERRKYTRCVMLHFHLAVHHVDQGAGDEIPITGRHLGQMQRCSRLEAMIHVIHDIL